MRKQLPFGARIKNIGVGGIGVLCFLMMAGLTFAAFFFTSDMNLNNGVRENVTFLTDNAWLNIPVLLFCLGIFWFLRPRLEQIPIKTLKKWLMFWVVGLGLLWVFSSLSYPSHDSRMVTQAGEACARGDYSLLTGKYFTRFPFQLGYVFYSELWMRLLPVKDFYLHIEAVNVLLLAAGYLAVLRFVETVFENSRVTRLTVLLLALCLQPILFSTFLYGTIPGLCCALWAVTHTALYLKKSGWKHAALASLFLGLAVLLKQNYLIVVVAVLVILLLALIQKPKWLHLGFAAMALVMVFGLQGLVTLQYEKRADVEFGSGIPLISWAAMGMNEGYAAPGWYNAKYTIKNFEKYDNNDATAGRASKEEIKKRLDTFRDDPAYTARFFSQKALSQWNEPTYQSLWTNQVRGHYTNGPWGPAQWVGGSGESVMKGYMGFYQQLIFLCTAAAILQGIRKKNLSAAVFPLILLGGFFYHLIFEGKSQYIIPYFVMMVPMAAYGLHLLLEGLDKLLQKYKKTADIPKKELKKAQKMPEQLDSKTIARSKSPCKKGKTGV